MSACCIQVQKRELPTGTVENYVQLCLAVASAAAVRQSEGRLEGSGRCGWTLEWVCFASGCGRDATRDWYLWYSMYSAVYSIMSSVIILRKLVLAADTNKLRTRSSTAATEGAAAAETDTAPHRQRRMCLWIFDL